MNNILIAFLFLIFISCKENKPHLNTEVFEKTSTNPVLGPDSSFLFFDSLINEQVHWQKADVFNPAAILFEGKINVLFRAEDNPDAILGRRTSRIGLAESENGIDFKKFPNPVLYPKNDAFKEFDFPGGCEDPRIVKLENGDFVLVYTSWNYAIPRLSVATSKDLKNWTKTGPAFLKAYNGKFKDSASKSGSIITTYKNGQYVALKKDDKYWMYWGEHLVNLAWSSNLVDWYPELNAQGELNGLIYPRDKYFDSHLTECGPPAVETDEGIVLIYNGRNSEDSLKSNPALPKGTYSIGKVIFDPKDLKTVKYRSEEPFIKPSLPHEVSGQYKAGTTFAEGLVYFKKKWFLYYGTADSYVGLAISNN